MESKMTTEQLVNARLTLLAERAPSGSEIVKVCIDMLEMLLEKNISYGNSALNPVNIFSKASTSEQILIRIDDKLNRIINDEEFKNEDTISDLIGYLLLLQVQKARERNETAGIDS